MVCNNIVRLFKKCDIFGVKPNFDGSPGSASVLGCLLTVVILGLSFMTLGVTLSHWNERLPIITQKQVVPADLHFKRTTGEGFRPAFCSGSSGDSAIQNGTVRLYFYQMIAGVKRTINTVAMSSGEKNLLGIGDNDALSQLSTS